MSRRMNKGIRSCLPSPVAAMSWGREHNGYGQVTSMHVLIMSSDEYQTASLLAVIASLGGIL